MKTVGVCGHFGLGLDLVNGQTIKTKIITSTFRKLLGREEVGIVDTHGGAKRVPGMCFDTFRLFKHCKNIVILPAHRGIFLYVPMCNLYNHIFHRKLHYIVIGGWLDHCVEKYSFLEKSLKNFDTICVETTTMKNALEKRGFQNVVILPNCKKLKTFHIEELPDHYQEPYRLCTFSRVMKEKGIEDIAHVVQKINSDAGRTIFTLDIYGEIQDSYEVRFEELRKEFPSYIRYCGIVDYKKTTEVLKDYFALAFPTRLLTTEGLPGTIIDAYASGLPVISARWESFDDLIDDGVTGIGFPSGNLEVLEEILLQISEHPVLITDKKIACLERAKEYSPELVLGHFIKTYM